MILVRIVLVALFATGLVRPLLVSPELSGL